MVARLSLPQCPALCNSRQELIHRLTLAPALAMSCRLLGLRMGALYPESCLMAGDCFSGRLCCSPANKKFSCTVYQLATQVLPSCRLGTTYLRQCPGSSVGHADLSFLICHACHYAGNPFCMEAQSTAPPASSCRRCLMSSAPLHGPTCAASKTLCGGSTSNAFQVGFRGKLLS